MIRMLLVILVNNKDLKNDYLLLSFASQSF